MEKEYTMKQWALAYANKGLAVFPLQPRGKTPLTKNGCRDATTDRKQIEAWWTKYPNANIGIATGYISAGLFVIDLDIDENKGINGYDTLRSWENKHGKIPDTWQSITGRGGYHLFFWSLEPVHNRVNLMEGIDIRGEGGYIVAPPSIHPNGRKYEWEQSPEEYELIEAPELVLDFIFHGKDDHQQFTSPAIIADGERNTTLFKLASSLQARGLDEDSIMVAVEKENEKKCQPPLSDQEIKTLVKSALRYTNGTAPYHTVLNNGSFNKVKCDNLELVSMNSIEEKSPEWLITDYMPKYQITVMAGDGGSGKTSAWCAIAAAISSGELTFLENFIPEDFTKSKSGKVLFFSSEDSFEYTLKGRLIKNRAKAENIYSISLKDERFADIKFNSPLLESLIDKYRPELVIFDPIQSFIPPDTQMGQRNAMRACLNPLIGMGEKYGTTFLIIVHANKQQGVYGRKRIADSSDIWDIARSVLMVGETQDKGVRYISHEKSNYGPTGQTVLFSIKDGEVIFRGYTEKKDRDFVNENDFNNRLKPQREDAREFILDFLKDGEKLVNDLDAMAKAQSISTSTLQRAKTELKKEGILGYYSKGFGEDKKFFCFLKKSSLIQSENVEE